MNDDALKYPVGRLQSTDAFSSAERRERIRQIADAPRHLRAAVAGLTDAQLDTPYRPGGWTVRQVVHHLFDSHVNAYCRFRLALTEDEPTIKPYREALWAELHDAKTAPVAPALDLLDGLHLRWVALLGSIPDAQFGRRLLHPESGRMTLDTLIAIYSWHGRHHVGHITALRARSGW
jgi:uncharacterized damage-inducible protein DinB